MIAFIKSDEIKELLSELRDIEERFWINYRNYRKDDRKFIEDNFIKIYEMLDSISSTNGVQEEMRIKYD